MEVGEREWLTDLRHQVGRLTRLTQDLIYLSRMEEGKPLSPPLEMVFSDVVEEEAQSFRGPALAKGRSLHLDITPMLTLQGEN